MQQMHKQLVREPVIGGEEEHILLSKRPDNVAPSCHAHIVLGAHPPSKAFTIFSTVA
jgi:hypothetical protein